MATLYDESILRSLRRITRSIDIYSRHLATRYQLTGPQLVCLMELAKNGPLAPSALANAVSLSQATITGILDRLEKRQLVTRRRSTTDKRRVAVELTPRGQNLVSAAPPPLHQRFSEQLARLSADEQASIDRVLRDVVEMMEATELEVAPLLAAGPAGVGVGEVKQFLEADQPGEPGPGTKK